MFFFQDVQFVNPSVLWLLLIAPAMLIWYFYNYRKRYATIRIPNLEANIFQLGTWRSRMRALLPLFRAIALFLLIIALARPQRILEEQEVKAEGIDIALVMDLSSSMLAQDFKPDRLEASKEKATDFVNNRPFDRIGLSVFAGEAFTQCPLTTDHNVIRDFLANLECGILDDGTAIGMGLASGVNRLIDSEAKSKVIILLTDGVNNAGYIKPMTAAEIAQKFNIKVYTIGVGTAGQALTPVSRRSDGRYIFGLATVEIDEELLKQIASLTGGQYFRATSVEGLAEIYSEIDQLEKTEMEVTVFRSFSEKFHAFAFWGMVFLVLELMLRYTFLRTIP